MLMYDWRRGSTGLELWLCDDTTDWTYIGEASDGIPLMEIRLLTAYLADYNCIDDALPWLAATNLRGGRTLQRQRLLYVQPMGY